MAGEQELVGLLYRADSSRLSLIADFHGMVDLSARFDMTNQGAGPWSPPSAGESPAGIRVVSRRLVIAPGGRYRFEEPGDADQVSWSVHPGLLLLHPRDLLEFTLSVRGTVVMAGRNAYDVVATPGPWRKGYAKPLERILAAVDAETGILLRREEIFEGKTVQLAEFTRVSFEAAEAAGAFASWPPDEDDDDADSFDSFDSAGPGAFGGPGWRAAKTAVNAAGSVLGTAVRHSRRRETGSGSGSGSGSGGGAAGDGDARDGDADAAMPADEPLGDEAVGGGAVSGAEFAYAIYRGGGVPFTGTLHRWTDSRAVTGELRSAADRHGWNGVGAFLAAVGDRAGTTHAVWRVRGSSGGRYRIDYVVNSHENRPATAMACDGQECWREYENRISIGPADRPSRIDHEIVTMVHASWLFGCELPEVREVTFGGRRAFAVEVVTDIRSSPTPFTSSDTQVVVDAELGIVLLMVSRVGGKPVVRSEFRDVFAGADDDAFVLDIPPGFPVVRHDGGLLNEIDMPEPVRAAAQAAGTAARAAKGFLDSLRGTRPRA